MKRQAWSTRSARNFSAASAHSAEDGGGATTTRDCDVTSGASRGHKQRQLAGTETDIMQQMLFSTKPPRPSASRERRQPAAAAADDLKPETKPIAAPPAERKRVSSWRGDNTADPSTASEAKAARERSADASDDDGSNASAGQKRILFHRPGPPILYKKVLLPRRLFLITGSFWGSAYIVLPSRVSVLTVYFVVFVCISDLFPCGLL